MAYTRGMRVLVVSCSLNPGSRSAVLASAAVEALRGGGHEVEAVDLRETALPMCDGAEAYADPAVGAMAARVSGAEAVLLAVPIYNYDVNAAAKNLIELTGGAWEGKVVGFLCAAGGQRSYMSVMPLANSLMLDFRCVIVPRFVYATAADFEGDALKDEMRRRVERLAEETGRLGAAWIDAQADQPAH